MKVSAPHPVFAWILDAWLISSLFDVLAKLWPAEAAMLPPIASSVIAVVVTFILPGCYHALWAASAQFLSFGERVGGCVLTNDGKRWLNPYGTSRTSLYLCLAGALFVGVTTSAPERVGPNLLLDLLALILAAFSMILLGRGYAWALFGIVAYRAWETVKAVPVSRLQISFEQLVWFTIGVHGWTLFLLVVCTAVAYSYSMARRRPVTEQRGLTLV